MNRNILLSLFLVLVLLFPAIFWTISVMPALADPEGAEPAYVGVAKYYDDRKCVVTSTHDDLARNTTSKESCLSMFTEKKIYHTVAIITNAVKTESDWDWLQYWVDQGYTEAGSHSRTHPYVPYTDYESEINGSKNDIIGNLTLPNCWRYGEREYVYAWIEPGGQYDETVRQWLGDSHYLSDRSVVSKWYDFAGWDSSKGLFHRVGYTVEMGSPPWGGDTSVSSLNAKFDTAYNNGKIYHLITHPSHVNWSEGSYADQHTDYISNRKDVWYVPFGLLYLYHWVDVRNIVNVTSTGSGLNKVFKLSIDTTDHLNYGVSYPITYVFDIPPDWSTMYAYYRYKDTDPWMSMANKSPMDFFNGITAVRFDSINHKAYVSVGFSNVSHNIYLRLRGFKEIGVPDDYPTIQEAINNANAGDTIYVRAGTYYEHVVINRTVSLIGENKHDTIIDGNWTIGNGIKITANDVTISGFTIRNNGLDQQKEMGNGIYVYGSVSGISVTNNIIVNNTNGIFLKNNPLGSIVTGNVVTNNNWEGIYLDGANDNIVKRNLVTNSDHGILLERSNNNTIIENTIKNNNYSIDVHSYSADNLIFHNNLINNTNQAFYEPSTSSVVWDNGCEGNYWSNYNGTDLNRDGIGDEYIPWEGVDYYPLMSPYMEGDVNHDATVNIVDIVIVVLAFNSTPEDPNWNPHADLYDDKTINIVDLVMVAIHFGETWAEER